MGLEGACEGLAVDEVDEKPLEGPAEKSEGASAEEEKKKDDKKEA